MRTLADLQLHREKLRLRDAEERVKDVYNASVDAADMRVDADKARTLIDRALSEMAKRMHASIRDETEETRIHFLLSDCATDILNEIGQGVEQSTQRLPDVGRMIRKGIKPRDLLTVSQWAEKYRVMSTGTNAPGGWKNSKNPHLTDIMDALSEHNPVRYVTFLKGVQVGGTEVMYNWIGYVMHHIRNQNMLLTTPDETVRDTMHNKRLRAMINETPVLNELVGLSKRRQSNEMIEFGVGVALNMPVATVPSTMGAHSVPYIASDEVDLYKRDVGGEGDPLTLLDNRQATFSRAKTLRVSTPRGEFSLISEGYEQSNQCLRYVPCPHCSAMHPLEFKHFGYDHREEEIKPGVIKKTVTDAWFACPECGGKIEEGHKTEIFERARWIPQRPHIKNHVGFKLPSYYSPIGLGRSWVEIAQLWVDAQGDSNRLKAFHNTILAQTYQEKTTDIKDLGLIHRLEPLNKGWPIKFITAGVDVQKNRIELTVVGWGDGHEAWVLDHVIIPGETEASPVWGDLLEELRARQVDFVGIDSGYMPHMVKSFCEGKAWAWPLKGQAGMDRQIVDDPKRRKKRLRARIRYGVRSEVVGVDQAKSILYERLRLPEPGPRYIHFVKNDAFDVEYFAQIGAEKKIETRENYSVTEKWVKTRARNEALDCLVYALATYYLADQKPEDMPVKKIKWADYGLDDEPIEATLSPTPAHAKQVVASPSPDPFAPIEFNRGW